MNQQELKDYLKAVCDAENGIFAISQEIDSLRSYQAEITDGTAPSKKEAVPVQPHITPVSSSEDEKLRSRYKKLSGLYGLATVVGIILGSIFGYNAAQNTFQSIRANYEAIGSQRTWFDELPQLLLTFLLNGLPILGACLGVVLLIRLVFRLRIKSRDRSFKAELANQYRALEAQTQAQQQRNEADFRAAVQAYRARQEINARLREDIDQEIDTLQTKKMGLEQSLHQLYAMNVLHAEARGMLSVNRLYQLIDMGICSHLEGENGAYAKLREDWNYDRICNSLEDLKQAVIEGTAQLAKGLQGLYEQLRKNHLDTLRCLHRIDRSIGSMEDSISTLDRDIMQGFDRMQTASSQINRGLDDISASLNTLSNNQYVTACEQGVRTYWLRYPR